MFESQLPVPDFPRSCSKGKGLNAADIAPVTHDAPLVLDFQQEHLVRRGSAVAVGKWRDEEHAAVFVEPNLTVNRFGDFDLNGSASGSFPDLVDHLLGKSIEQQ
jgi:hypothetical protein